MKATFKSIAPAVMIAATLAWPALAEGGISNSSREITDRQFPDGYIQARRAPLSAPKQSAAQQTSGQQYLAEGGISNSSREITDRQFPDGYIQTRQTAQRAPKRSAELQASDRQYASEKQYGPDRQYSSPPSAAPAASAQASSTQPYATSTPASSPEPFGTVAKAKGVIGMEVQNGQNEKIGKVEDVAMSFSSGRVVAVVVSVGGVLGVGDTLIAVPPSEFRQDYENKVLHLNRNKDELKNAPKLDISKWDEFQQPSNLAEVYRYYGVKPYATDVTDTTTRYRTGTDSGPSAFQQGNNDSDLKTTAAIRKDLLRRDDLSISAHNVTIVTLNGRVTLRGTVSSEDEKRIVGEVAQNATSAGSIENQLEVTSATNK